MMGQRRRRSFAWRLYLAPALVALLSLQCDAVEVEAITCPNLIAPASFEAGETITVAGEQFGRGACDRALGCTSRAAPTPLKNIDVILERGEESWPLATVDADRALKFTVEVVIPSNVTAGGATLSAGNGQLAVQIEDGSRR